MFFNKKHVKLIEDPKDIENPHKEIIFHSFTNNWALARRSINKTNIKIFKKFKNNSASFDRK